MLVEDLKRLGACNAAVMHAQAAGWKSLDDAREWFRGAVAALLRNEIHPTGGGGVDPIPWAWWLVARLYPLPETLIYLRDVLGDPHVAVDVDPHRLFENWWKAPNQTAYWYKLDQLERDRHWQYMPPALWSDWGRMLQLLWTCAAPADWCPYLAVRFADCVHALVYSSMYSGSTVRAPGQDIGARRLASCKRWLDALEALRTDRGDYLLERALRMAGGAQGRYRLI